MARTFRQHPLANLKDALTSTRWPYFFKAPPLLAVLDGGPKLAQLANQFQYD